MQVRIWGSRGSLATPGPETVRYGGNTSCVEARLEDGTLIVLDAGTGIRPLGISLLDDMPKVVHLFLSHLHLDHLVGLAFFAPLWNEDVELHIWGPPSATRPLRQRVGRYLSPPLFPVALEEIPSGPIFHDARGSLGIGSALVTAKPVSHRGPTVGYRIEDVGRTLAYLPDHEPALGIPLREVGPEWISGYSLAAGADVLLHDAQYSEDEYPRFIGWGHSSVAHVVDFARIAEAKQLVMFHHDPGHNDDQLDLMAERAGELWDADGEGPILAHEGMAFDLSGSAA